MIPRPIITLTTDFGTEGSYVAAMKGVILGIQPAAQLVDITHGIGAQNVREAAFQLAQVIPYFPPETVHLVVVDPGVGTIRRILYVKMHGQHFVAPDNGVLSWVARTATELERIALTEPRFWAPQVSDTFHGRDIIAPVAGHLSRGIDPRQLGQSVSEWVELPWPQPNRAGKLIQGEVLAADHFGNLITNISESDLAGTIRNSMVVSCMGQEISRWVRSYAEASPGELLLLIGSSGLLEIAVREGSARDQLRCSAGSTVRIHW